MSKVSIQKIDLENVVLSFNNPRWRTIPDLKTNLINMIVQNSDKASEKRAIRKIFELEGDLRDFVDLVKSIAKGFRNYEQGIFVFQKNNKQYVVAEGSRRILALKLLRKLVELPNFLTIKRHYEYDPDDDWDEEYSVADQEKMFKNYLELKRIIDSQIVFYKSNKFDFLLIDQNKDDLLWEVLFSKHINGRQIGMRRWGLGKYFIDLLNFFPNGINSKYEKADEKWIENRLQRKLSKIKQDYKQAQFVFAVADVDWKDETRTKKWMIKQPVAALQSNFCLNLIKKLATNHNYTNEDFKKLIFNFNYDKENYRLKFINEDKKLLKKDHMLSFIREWFKKDVITTRKKLPKREYEFAIAFAELIDKPNAENPFFWHKDRISIEISSTKDLWKKYVLKKLLDVKTKQEEISQKIAHNLKKSRGFWAQTLKGLGQQLGYNARNHLRYINSSTGTVRLIFEILVVVSLFFDPDNLKLTVEWITRLSRINFQTRTGRQLGDKEKFCFLVLTNRAKIAPISWFLTKIFKQNTNSEISSTILNILSEERPLFLDQPSYILSIWKQRFLMDEVIHNYFQTLKKRAKKVSPILAHLNLIYDTYNLVTDLLNYLDISKINAIDEMMINVQKDLKDDEIITSISKF